MQAPFTRLTSIAVGTAGKRVSCVHMHMLKRPMVQVHSLSLFFFLSNLFDDMLYAIHGSMSSEILVVRPCAHGRKRPGRLFQSTRVYDGQICLITGELADHGNSFPSSPPFIFFLSKNSSPSFLKQRLLFYSFYYDFLFVSSFYREKRYFSFSAYADGTLPCSMRIVC